MCKHANYKNITLIQEDAAKLKLKNNSVDAIISVIGLSAIPEHKSALKNCYSALKKGGRLVVLDAKQPNKKYGLWSLLLGLLRWSKSYEKKDLIKDIKKVFGNIQVEEHVLGSTFISVSKK